jgi:hypothetical protein
VWIEDALQVEKTHIVISRDISWQMDMMSVFFLDGEKGKITAHNLVERKAVLVLFFKGPMFTPRSL